MAKGRALQEEQDERLTKEHTSPASPRPSMRGSSVTEQNRGITVFQRALRTAFMFMNFTGLFICLFGATLRGTELSGGSVTVWSRWAIRNISDPALVIYVIAFFVIGAMLEPLWATGAAMAILGILTIGYAVEVMYYWIGAALILASVAVLLRAIRRIR